MSFLLSTELLKPISSTQVLMIKNWIGNNPERFAELMEAFLHGSVRQNQMAATVLGKVLKNEPQLILPYHAHLLQKLEKPMHNAVIRNTVRIWQWVPLPAEFSGAIANYCLLYLQDPGQPIAVRAFSMGVLFRLGQEWPEIMEELRLHIEDLLPNEKSPAIRNRGSKILHGTFRP